MYCYVTVEIYDDATRQWTKYENMGAVVKDGCLYMVNMRNVSKVAALRAQKQEEFQKAEKNQRYKLAEKVLKEIIESCEISKEVLGQYYSKSTLWRIKPKEDNNTK